MDLNPCQDRLGTNNKTGIHPTKTCAFRCAFLRREHSATAAGHDVLAVTGGSIGIGLPLAVRNGSFRPGSLYV